MRQFHPDGSEQSRNEEIKKAKESYKNEIGHVERTA
jgi:hypothetical protein